MARPINDLTGKKYGKLTVISRAENKGTQTRWLCECDCGKRKIVQAGSLVSGDTKSCGCLRGVIMGERLRTHGTGKESRLYRIWTGIKTRCYNPNHNTYKIYGKRGIKMCEEWKNSFVSFRDWSIKNGYSDSLSLDRIDVNGDYEPSNCRWATKKQQANNTRSNVYISYKGETHTLAEWSDITGIKELTLASRKRKGWSDEECIEVPLYSNIRKYRNKNSPI